MTPSSMEDSASPNALDFSHGLVISHHPEGDSEQSLSPEGINEFQKLDEKLNLSIVDAKLSELPPTPAPSVVAGNRSCPRSRTASALHCPLPMRNSPNSVCNGGSRSCHGQTHVSSKASEPKYGQCEMPISCCKEISYLELAECGDLDQGQSQAQASKGASRIQHEGHTAAFQNILGLANNLAKLAYSLSLLQRPCHTSHTRCECQECRRQALHATSSDHAKCSTQQRHESNCDAPELDSCLISPVDTARSHSGIFEGDDDELRLENLLTTSWPAADVGQNLCYQEL